MTTSIRPEISKKNKYYISKHRYYELKHFCLQYYEWKELLGSMGYSSCSEISRDGSIQWSDKTYKSYIFFSGYMEKIKLVETCAMDASSELGAYILKAVTEDLSYTQLRMRYNIPCGRDSYYELYRRFYYILSHKLQLLI